MTASDHIAEQHLEMLAFAPDRFSSQERERIESHLAVCTSCRETWERFVDFYKRFHEHLAAPPIERDRALAEKILVKQRKLLPFRKLELPAKVERGIETYFQIIEPYRRSLPQRIIRYIQVHPIRSAGGFSLAAALIAVAVSFLKPIHDTNPAFAKVEIYVLKVYNKEAEVLWSKSVIGMPDRSTASELMMHGERKYLLLGDLDGNGINEVLISGANRRGAFSDDSLYCYEHDGSLRWAVNIGTIISFGDSTILQHSVPTINNILIMKRTPSSHPQLFMLANEVGFSPTKLSELDPRTGRELQAYYNRGGSQTLLSLDIDRDREEDLILLGVNDAFNRAYLAVLDPSNINGHAPVTPQYLPRGVPEAHERYYLLFPTTILGQRYSQVPYNMPYSVQVNAGKRLILTIREPLGNFPVKDFEVQVVYTLDSTLRVESVAAGDGFIKANNYLVEHGLLQKSLIPKYLNELKGSVLYWDGEKFVGEPVMNRTYVPDKLSIKVTGDRK